MQTNGLNNQKDYSKRVERVLLVILLLNILVMIIKLIAGWLSSSLTIIVDTIHSTIDAANNVVGVLIIRYASAPPDKEHPYGHAKFETLGAFFIASFLAVTCFEIGSHALKQFFNQQPTILNINKLTFLMIVLTIVINFIVASYEAKQGKILNSPLLMADASHTMSDIYVSLSVLTSLFFSYLGYEKVDSFFALVVTGFIAYQSYQIFRQTIPILVDAASLDSSEIESVALAVSGVKACNNIRSRGKAGDLFVEMVVLVTPDTLTQAHFLTEQIESKLREKFGQMAITIHFEPTK
ncbi:MAG: cation transporter [Acidobacteria bacterium]|nr:cation transporter [Acidobacteriota bacterium]